MDGTYSSETNEGNEWGDIGGPDLHWIYLLHDSGNAFPVGQLNVVASVHHPLVALDSVMTSQVHNESQRCNSNINSW